jgi:hypothetical protein
MSYLPEGKSQTKKTTTRTIIANAVINKELARNCFENNCALLMMVLLAPC